MALPSEGTFGDLVRRLRKAAGLTQAELAERAGLSPRGLNDLERGARTTPRRETARLLADALGLVGAERDQFLTSARRTPPEPATSAPLPAPLPAPPTSPTAAPDVPSALPTGTVTFLFTDIEHSTQTQRRVGADYARVLEEHQALNTRRCCAPPGRPTPATRSTPRATASSSRFRPRRRRARLTDRHQPA